MPNNRWTYNVPYTEFPGQSSSTIRGGHPTAVGPNKRMIAVKLADGTYVYPEVTRDPPPREGSKNIGNGVPGTPRLYPPFRNSEPIPGEFGRPIQEGTNYNNGSDISGP